MNITKIKPDVNGNSRRVVHFLELLTEDEVRFCDQRTPELTQWPNSSTSYLYEKALSKARKIGGKKFHNRQFGGGIVFQSYSDRELEARILSVK